jgi:hypothetical protein
VSAIEKRCITDVAHYLKPYGLGLFGIIFTRQRPSSGAIHAVQKQSASNQKMIVVLDDNDTIEMIERRRDGANPEQVISERISAFRKRM